MSSIMVKPREDDDGDVCSITLEKLGVNPEMLLGVPIASSISPLSNRPDLSVVQPPCQHSFNAMALIIHFAHNGMQCPLCRHGDASGRLSLSKTFGNEQWVESMQTKIESGSRGERMVRLDDMLLFCIFTQKKLTICQSMLLLCCLGEQPATLP